MVLSSKKVQKCCFLPLTTPLSDNHTVAYCTAAFYIARSTVVVRNVSASRAIACGDLFAQLGSCRLPVPRISVDQDAAVLLIAQKLLEWAAPKQSEVLDGSKGV